MNSEIQTYFFFLLFSFSYENVISFWKVHYVPAVFLGRAESLFKVLPARRNQ